MTTSPRKLLLVAAMITAAVIGATTQGTAAVAQPHPDVASGSVAPGTPIWFETSKGKLRLATKSGATKDLATFPSGLPAYSEKQHLLSFVVEGQTNVATTVSRTGKQVDSFDCGCGAVVWFGNQLAGVSGHDLVLRNVGTHKTHRITLRGQQYKTNHFRPEPFALVAVGKSLIVSGATALTSAYGGPENLYRVTSKGKISQLAHNASFNVVISHAITDGHGHVAYVDTAHGGDCANYDSIDILDLKSGKISEPTLPKLNRPWNVASLRYLGGTLQVGLASAPKSCLATNRTSEHGHSTAHLYKVSSAGFSAAGAGLADQAKAGHSTATIAGSGTAQTVGGYDAALRVSRGSGASKLLAPKVFAFGWL